MKSTKSLCLLLISILFLTTGCTSYPTSLDKNFQLVGKNNSELKTVICRYSTLRADSLKIKTAILLIENMDVHISYVRKSWDIFKGNWIFSISIVEVLKVISQASISTVDVLKMII